MLGNSLTRENFDQTVVLQQIFATYQKFSQFWSSIFSTTSQLNIIEVCAIACDRNTYSCVGSLSALIRIPSSALSLLGHCRQWELFVIFAKIDPLNLNVRVLSIHRLLDGMRRKTSQHGLLFSRLHMNNYILISISIAISRSLTLHSKRHFELTNHKNNDKNTAALAKLQVN